MMLTDDALWAGGGRSALWDCHCHAMLVIEAALQRVHCTSVLGPWTAVYLHRPMIGHTTLLVRWSHLSVIYSVRDSFVQHCPSFAHIANITGGQAMRCGRIGATRTTLAMLAMLAMLSSHAMGPLLRQVTANAERGPPVLQKAPVIRRKVGDTAGRPSATRACSGIIIRAVGLAVARPSAVLPRNEGIVAPPSPSPLAGIIRAQATGPDCRKRLSLAGWPGPAWRIACTDGQGSPDEALKTTVSPDDSQTTAVL